MTHVFISYSKKNRGYARKLADFLLASGFDVWIDDRIDFGSNWEREIFAAIDGCAAIIVIMTPESYDSLWVQRERQYAERRGKQPFPLLLEGEPFPFYVVIQHYDVRGEALPGAEFLEQLAEYAPRRPTAGHNVAAAPQQQARIKFETGETAKAGDAAPPVPALPVEAAPPARPASASSGRSRGWLVLAAAVLVLALAGALIVAAYSPDLLGLAAPQPTPSGGGHGTLAFATDRDGNYEIYLIDLAGNLQNLTNEPEADIEPAWSPDGSQIVFTSYRGDGNARIYLMNADGSDVRLLVAESGGWEPAWSPGGDQIAFTSYGDNSQEIFVINTDGSGLRALTDNDYLDGYAAWSPDGTQIVYVSQPQDVDDLYITDLDSGDSWSLTHNSEGATTPAWSPDGTMIAFEYSPNDYPQICVLDPDGNNLRCISSDDGDAYEPAWSPDGTMIAFTSYRDSNSGREIYTMDVDGHNVTRITDDPGEDLTPAWRP